MNLKDAIAAIATPPGTGGVGVIRLSGENASRILAVLFHCPSLPGAGSGAPDFSPRRMYYGRIIEPQGGQVVDDVLAVHMPGPHSYTGEDVCEIHAHGGQVVLDRILDLVLEQGARLAEPGEFTRRAFLNGRMDLSQAEAVMDIIQAQTRTAARLAAAHASGALREAVDAVMGAVHQVQVEMEACLDFGDEAPDPDPALLRSALQKQVLAPLEALLRNARAGGLFTHGICAAITGKPNVGKSSLMNALLGSDRCLVSPTPGTTRDMVSDTALVHGMPVRFCDTAGLREPGDGLEALGVERTRAALEKADLILAVVDLSQPLHSQDRDVLAHVQALGKPGILVCNKLDLAPQAPGHPPAAWPGPWVCTSAKNGTGLDILKDQIAQSVRLAPQEGSGLCVTPRPRHAALLQQALAAAAQAVDRLHPFQPELAAVDLAHTQETLGMITGATAAPGLLDSIFSQFCIGK